MSLRGYLGHICRPGVLAEGDVFVILAPLKPAEGVGQVVPFGAELFLENEERGESVKPCRLGRSQVLNNQVFTCSAQICLTFQRTEGTDAFLFVSKRSAKTLTTHQWIRRRLLQELQLKFLPQQ